VAVSTHVGFGGSAEQRTASRPLIGKDVAHGGQFKRVADIGARSMKIAPKPSPRA
jgi:hypothetical protein